VRALIVIAILAVAPAARAERSPGQAEFEAATAREGRGDFQGASDALEQLARARPDDPFADDALFEAAVIAEEHLADPARAARLYEEVATKYPTSRLARRARTRADFLGASLKTGEAPLREYQDILNGFSKRPPSESSARMKALLDRYPDFALADRALYWLGTAYVEQQREPEALARFTELERRFPRTEWAARSKKARGDLALRDGHPFQARAIYEELGQSGDLLARAAAEEGRTAVKSAVRRTILLWITIAYLVVFLAIHALALRRLKPARRVPTEILFYLPVALLFSLAALTEAGAIAAATAAIAAGGAVVVWLTSLANAARLARAPIPLLSRLTRACALAGAIFSVMYIAIQTTGLTDLVVETLRSGPER
jgi:TolA-binding protein